MNRYDILLGKKSPKKSKAKHVPDENTDRQLSPHTQTPRVQSQFHLTKGREGIVIYPTDVNISTGQTIGRPGYSPPVSVTMTFPITQEQSVILARMLRDIMPSRYRPPEVYIPRRPGPPFDLLNDQAENIMDDPPF